MLLSVYVDQGWATGRILEQVAVKVPKDPI